MFHTKRSSEIWFQTTSSLSSIHPVFKRYQNPRDFLRVFDRSYRVKQFLRFSKFFLHHAQPLFQAGDGVFVVRFFGETQMEKLVYPHRNFGEIGIADGSAVFVLFDLARQIGADDGAAAEHDAVAARHLFNADIVFEAEHVAVGGYGDGDVFTDFAYPFPMRGRFVAFDFGARVYSQGAGSAFGNGGGTFEREAFIFVTEPHFAGERDMFGQALAQGFDDMVDEVGLFEQDGAAFVFVDCGGGTAEIEVDFVRAEADGFQGVDRHIVGIATQKLDGTGRTGGGLVAVGDFGGVFEPGGTGMDGVGNADELADAFVVAADTGQQIAHHIVHQPLHGRKDKLHIGGGRLKKGNAYCSGISVKIHAFHEELTAAIAELP